MNREYRGVQYTIAQARRPDLWQWRVMVGNPEMLRMGETATAALADTEVRQVIDRAFKVQQGLQTRRARARLDRDRR